MKKTKLFKFFDRLEDKIRATLSRVPILYALIGGTGIVLFWRGVWHSADLIIPLIYTDIENTETFRLQLLDSSTTLLLAIVVLLTTGLFVTNFIGNRIIISGLKHEKKLEEKEAEEIESEENILNILHKQISAIQKDIEEIKNNIKK